MRRLRWLASVVCLTVVVLAAWRVDWRAAGATLGKAALLPLLVAMMANFLSLTLRGIRWWIFLRAVGADSLSLAIRGAVAGAGFNNLLVANGGDAARVLLVAHASGVSRSSVLATLTLERLFDPVCFGLLLLLATFVVPLPPSLVGLRGLVGSSLLIVLTLIVVLVRTRDPEAVVDGGARRAGGRLVEFLRCVQGLATGKRFVAALLASISVWTLQVSEFVLVAHASHLALPIGGSVAAMLLINTGLVVRATPGNIGYFQFAYAAAASRFGVPVDAAVAAAILIQILEMVPVTLASFAIAPGMLRRRRTASTSSSVTELHRSSMVASRWRSTIAIHPVGR